MATGNPRSTASIAGHPIHAALVPFPVACFIGTWLSDLAYWKTAQMLWANIAVWLLTVGLLVSVLVVVAGLIDFAGDRRIRAIRNAWVHGLGNGLALVIAIFNAFVHSRDAYTSVVPTGLILSTLTVLILGLTAWTGADLVFRHGVGVRTDGMRPEDRA
jgi:uncharacterized membrane protein